MASVTRMAASHRLEEDLIEWRGLSELLVFPLKDIEFIGPTLRPSETGLIARLDEQDKERTRLFVVQGRKGLHYESQERHKKKGMLRGSGGVPSLDPHAPEKPRWGARGFSFV